jgi:pSer/pThr/pTyr-binding forkhead associated (FHA) protein
MQEEDTINPDLIPTKTLSNPRKHPCLIMISGKMVGRKFTLDQSRFIIGRGTEVQIPLEEQTVSRRHAELVIRSSLVMIKDLKSKNGLYVNDVKVAGSTLKDGDIIRIGNTVFKFIAGGKNESLYYHEGPSTP